MSILSQGRGERGRREGGWEWSCEKRQINCSMYKFWALFTRRSRDTSGRSGWRDTEVTEGFAGTNISLLTPNGVAAPAA